MIVRYVFAIFVALSYLLCISCTQPVQNETLDQKEFASVWQYLKTFSIYQDPFPDKIPPNPFVFNSPQDMLDQINDTLKGNSYTGYMDKAGYYFRPFDGLRKSSIDAGNVYLDSLTDSCCLLTISSFSDDLANNIYDEFKALLPQMNRFSKIIFDVRSNVGGDLTITDSIIEDILPAGIRYIRTLERVYNASAKTASTIDSIWQTKRPAKSAFANKKFAVLIDDWSASASEIFAIALKDGFGAPVFGVKSYGKAIGQIHLNRRGRYGLMITYVHFFRITDLDKKVYEDYHRKGISPDPVTNQLVLQGINEIDKPLFYAIKTLQPSVTKIKYPLSKMAASSAPKESGLYKNIDESEL